MSEHSWCRDVSRDEAVRAAEDAAAVPSIQHRDLPEQVALLRASVADILGRVVRIEGEIDAGEDEARRQSAAWDGARQAYSDAIKRLTAERDAARADAEHDVREVLALARQERDAARAECERLRARVAELEAVKAANAGGGNQLIGLSPAERDGLQVIADGVRRYAHGFIVTASSDEARAVDSVLARHSPAAPPETRSWLTAEERDAVADAATTLHELSHFRLSWALHSLLARESPPRVKVPHLDDLAMAVADSFEVTCKAWIAAIREAGGEVAVKNE